MTKSCVLFSGGMDSFLAWKLFNPAADLVFIDIGQPYVVKELRAAHLTARSEHTKLVRFVTEPIAEKPMPSGIVLHRNALLILTAARHYNDITLGVVADEINSDKSPEFFTAMKRVLDISHRGQYWNDGVGVSYYVGSPISGYTKSQLVELYVRRGHSVETLLQTVSCYEASYHHCGNCPSCFKRWVALVNNGIFQRFLKDPRAFATQTGIIAKALDGTYGAARAAEILTAMKHESEWLQRMSKC